MKILFFLIFLFLIMSSMQLLAQQDIFITGKVFNSTTQQPIAFASVALKNNNLGVISNADGDFVIPSNPIFQPDSLIITFIGFKRTTIPFSALSISRINKIYITPMPLELSGVEVVAKGKKIDPEKIIRRAIRNIRRNCPAEPFNYVSYYRDYQKKGNTYINLNEAIVQTLDNGFNKYSTTNTFRLLDFRQNMDFQRLDIPPFYGNISSAAFDNPDKFIQNAILPDQGGNELFILMIHDPVRNSRTQTFSFINTLYQDFITNHSFSGATTVYSNNTLLYKISFTAKRGLTGDSLLVSGNIYIQPENYAIHKIEYSGSYVLKGNKTKNMYDVDIEYGRENSADSLMALKYISFNNIFNTVDKTDSTYFRILGSYTDPDDLSNSTLLIYFNRNLDVKTASIEDNYEISLEGEKALISDISVIGDKVIIKIEHKKVSDWVKPHIEVAARNINDINGNILNQTKKLEYYQYRELFVQEYNKPISISESCFMQNVPLIQNCISKYSGNQKYWMNTPINPDTSEVAQSLVFADFDSGSTGNNTSIETDSDKFQLALLPALSSNSKSFSELSDSPVGKHLSDQQKSIGSDQLFVQLDRNVYTPGDTIYFAAYVRDQFTGAFGSKTTAMYALLFNEDKVKVDSSRFKIRNSAVSGWMVIPEKAEPGKYHFAAFTSSMQNYDPADAFQIDLFVKKLSSNPDKITISFNKEIYYPGDILEATVRITDPVGSPVNKQKFNGSLSAGKYFVQSAETQTNKKGESLIKFTIPDTIASPPRFKVVTQKSTNNESVIKDVSVPYEDPYFELRFLPEGGTFIEGLRQRIGFNATNFKGEPVLIEGLLKNSSGSVLDTIKSGTFGPGCFSCISQPGLYVEIFKGAATEKIWPLPVPSTEGFSFHITPVDSRSFVVEVESNKYSCDTVTVSGVMNLTEVFSQELILNKKKHFVVKTDELPSGIATITLFNKNLRPIAERLFYVNNDKHLKFNIKSDKYYDPGQETELEISVTDGQGNPAEGYFSIAVTDSARGINSELFSPGIEYAFNYHPFFPGNLPPKVLAKGIENITDAERDLLLMVYGWSRINWDPTQEKPGDNQLTNYDMLNMRILYALQGHRAGRSMDLVSLEGPSIMHLTTNIGGEIHLPLDSLPEITRSVVLMPDVNTKNKALSSMLSIPYNEQYFKSNKLFIPQASIPSVGFNVAMPARHISSGELISSPADSYIPLGEGVIQLPEVTIKARPIEKKFYHDKYEEEYQYTNIKSLDYKLLWSSSSLEIAIRKLVNPFSITDKSVILRAPRSFFGGPVPALIVLDGQPLYTYGWPMVSSISPSQVTSLTILNSPRGYTMYGAAAQGGVIFINTMSSDPNLKKLHSDWISQNKKDKMLIPIEIYRPTIEFYNPTKAEKDADPVFQNRATIFWESEVYFDGEEPLKIRYTNSKHQGPVTITINGVSVDNLFGNGKAGYVVQ